MNIFKYIIKQFLLYQNLLFHPFILQSYKHNYVIHKIDSKYHHFLDL